MRALPIVVFLILTGIFAWRLVLIGHGKMPNDIPSVLLNKPAPEFKMASLFKGKSGLKTSDLKGKVTLVSFFASWCLGCLAEHPYLAVISGKGAVLVGVDYKDTAPAGQAWLKKEGNPYDAVVTDPDGRAGIDFGVYGVPESYLIDKDGIIRYKQTGPMSPEDTQAKILPLIRKLNK